MIILLWLYKKMPLYLEIPEEILIGQVTCQGFTLKYYSKKRKEEK